MIIAIATMKMNEDVTTQVHVPINVEIIQVPPTDKEVDFKKGNKIMYTIKDSNGNTYPVRRLSERVYESKEHKTLFITDEEGVVTGIYKEK